MQKRKLIPTLPMPKQTAQQKQVLTECTLFNTCQLLLELMHTNTVFNALASNTIILEALSHGNITDDGFWKHVLQVGQCAQLASIPQDAGGFLQFNCTEIHELVQAPSLVRLLNNHKAIMPSSLSKAGGQYQYKHKCARNARRQERRAWVGFIPLLVNFVWNRVISGSCTAHG